MAQLNCFAFSVLCLLNGDTAAPCLLKVTSCFVLCPIVACRARNQAFAAFEINKHRPTYTMDVSRRPCIHIGHEPAAFQWRTCELCDGVCLSLYSVVVCLRRSQLRGQQTVYLVKVWAEVHSLICYNDFSFSWISVYIMYNWVVDISAKMSYCCAKRSHFVRFLSHESKLNRRNIR